MSEELRKAEPVARWMPMYGAIPWDDLIAAVCESQTGRPDTGWTRDDSYFIGHQLVSINMNSLNRIVSMFAAAQPQQATACTDPHCPCRDGDTCHYKDGADGTKAWATQPQQAAPSRSQRMRDAGFTPRDNRLECDECGQKVMAQFMPIHKCAQQAAQPQQATGTEAAVCNDIRERQAFGITKYGTTVRDNPLPLRQWLQHAYEECLDQAVYLKRAMEEMDKKT